MRRGLLLASGAAEEFIPLNGSSEDRLDARAFHFQYALALRVNFEGSNSFCRFGGREGARGYRYLTAAETRFRMLRWTPWRKAKRLVRKGVMRLATDLKQDEAAR